KRQVKALHDAGVRILAGTDSSTAGVVWGFALHQELEFLVEAGLTPYQALEAATRLPAEVFDNPEEWGTVAVGKRADLLLLQANPLEKISHAQQIAGVMVRGRWLPQTELQGMLDELATKYQAEQTRMEEAVELEPFSGTFFSGLAPVGWNELEPGVYARSNPEIDPTMLVQLAAPGVEAKVFALDVLGKFGVTELPAPGDRFESAHLAWDLYRIKSEMAPLGLALAEKDGVAYLILLAAPPDHIDTLAETVFLPALNALTPSPPATDASSATIVFIVRHAEKSASSGDVPLTAAGQARAQALADLLGQAGVSAIFASEFVRTQQTVEPLARQLGLDIRQIPVADVEDLVDQILSAHAGEVVMVAGHSNTVPVIIQKLGGDVIPFIPETEFDNLYVVTIHAPGIAEVVHLNYGQLD
ncbi:MAG: amidohydrolase family protein, partial [bacterium]|nr:amidohydrolase family protein [bacterium]